MNKEVEAFVRENLGKRVYFEKYVKDGSLYRPGIVEGMIVGFYNSVLVSMTNKDEGWQLKDHGDSDWQGTLLISSPLNQSYWHLSLDEILQFSIFRN